MSLPVSSMRTSGGSTLAWAGIFQRVQPAAVSALTSQLQPVAKQVLQLAQRFGTQEGRALRVTHDLTPDQIDQWVGSSRATLNRVEGRLTDDDPATLSTSMPVELTTVPWAADDDGHRILPFLFQPAISQEIAR
jgi:hypothetical protein